MSSISNSEVSDNNSKLELAIVTKEESEVDEMKDALFCIAREIQRFRNRDLTVDLSDAGILNYKSQLKMKRKKIQNLKEHLNTACKIAKTVISAKEMDFQTFNEHLNITKCESAILQKKHSESSETVYKLRLENQALAMKLQNLTNFIDLGYKELYKIRKEDVKKNVSVEGQLKEIMVSCGQYYADFSNERDKYNHLEQKNRFLANKMSILEAHLESATEELKAYRQSRKSNVATEESARLNGKNTYRVGYVCSEYQFGSEANVSKLSLTTSNTSTSTQNDKNIDDSKLDELDLTSHISLVQNLLSDQDMMLQDLKKLSQEFTSF